MKGSAAKNDEKIVICVARIAIAIFALMLVAGLFCCAGGHTDSAVGSAAPTITSSQAVTPTFSPTAGNYNITQSVTISTSTPGCSKYIYLNTTGNPTSSDTRANSVNVASSETVYARVIGCPSYRDSAVASAAYTISGCPSTTPCNTTLISTFTYSNGNL